MTRLIAFVSLAGLAAVCLGPILMADDKPQGSQSQGKDRVFEMRTYYTHEGRLPALNKRFREHTCDLFKKHGIDLIGFWTPLEEKEGRHDKLVYILAYPSREAANASWDAFRKDPEWLKAQAESEKDGKIVKKVESVFLNPTDYSLIK
jgi:NIPSNAP